jgi:predicted permease
VKEKAEPMLHDLKYALRSLLKSPGFTAIAVLSLALAIGAGTAVFSVANAILLSSMPVPNPQELRLIDWSGADFKGPPGEDWVKHEPSGRWKSHAFSRTVFESLREQCAAEAEIFGFVGAGGFPTTTARTRHGGGHAEGLRVSDNFFSGMDVQPFLGRLIGPDDDRPGAAAVVVLSYRWWEEQFDLDPGVIGQSILLNGLPFTVVGVLPRGFPGVGPSDIEQFYIALSAPQLVPEDLARHSPDDWSVLLMARLNPGVNDAQFQAALNVAFSQAAANVIKAPTIRLTDGRAGLAESERDSYRPTLLLLLGVVGVILLVACANIAGLMLARGSARQHELAVRAALGAGRWRLIQQSLTESALIASLGGALGVAMSFECKKILIQWMSADAPWYFHYDVGMDLRVVAFALGISLITALLSGLMPALRAGGADPVAGLKDRGTFSPLRLRTGRILVAAQVALSLLLVAGAGLFARTLINLAQVNPGFATDHLLLFHIAPRQVGYSPSQEIALSDRIQRSLAAIPGVRAVGLNDFPLLSRGWWVGFTFQMPESDVQAALVNETFFNTMGIPIVLGRDLRISDDEGSTKVIVVNQAFANAYFSGRNPIGQIIRGGKGQGADWQIVGVCGNIRAKIRTVEPMAFFSFRQRPPHLGVTFNLRTVLPPLTLLPAVRQAMAQIDPNIPLTDIQTQEQVRDASISDERMFAQLCGSLALLALLLSCIGLYGLMAYHVARRTSEIGIRMALGATRPQIAIPIVRESLLLACIGVVIGMPLVFAMTQLIRGYLFGIQPSDPLTLIGAGVLLMIVAFVAACFPARRAANVDPMVALRCE